MKLLILTSFKNWISMSCFTFSAFETVGKSPTFHTSCSRCWREKRVSGQLMSGGHPGVCQLTSAWHPDEGYSHLADMQPSLCNNNVKKKKTTDRNQFDSHILESSQVPDTVVMHWLAGWCALIGWVMCADWLMHIIQLTTFKNLVYATGQQANAQWSLSWLKTNDSTEAAWSMNAKFFLTRKWLILLLPWVIQRTYSTLIPGVKLSITWVALATFSINAECFLLR